MVSLLWRANGCHGNFSVTQESVPQAEAAAAAAGNDATSDTKEPAKVDLTRLYPSIRDVSTVSFILTFFAPL